MSVKTLNLVIVDDDPSIVRIVEHMVHVALSDHFAVSTFTDSSAAREWIARHGCDVLVSDIEMPGASGLDLLRAGIERNPDIETIFLTAHSSWEHVAEAIELGASDYLLKPVDQAALISLLRQKHQHFSHSSAVVYEMLNEALAGDNGSPAPATA